MHWKCLLLSAVHHPLGSAVHFEEGHNSTKPTELISTKIISASSDALFPWKLFDVCIGKYIDNNGKTKINNHLSFHQILK